ncbi:Glyoxalase/bleomycin resistance protein/dioxygenase [Nitrosotalea devaniterrae]|uniref:Glyoxalase/bleomycin resistance protein/dioxygenase n=1 Tax=Nitrosotalea devaniterrae TaxID=1078905 RepID=A0A128A4E5_9ARCH|nr:Glyoxalase/bleomycin resistance protein/dioxygenase [Candidatus Nitrosotalea devanaterra]
MGTKVFVNLPVKDLEKSKEFFTKLGFTFNLQFTNKDAACMVISEENYAMLLMESFFKTFTKKEIVNAKQSTEVLVALSAESKENVDKMLHSALDAGAKEANEPQDHGFMYGRSFEDLDGHIWEIFWMDPKVIVPS